MNIQWGQGYVVGIDVYRTYANGQVVPSILVRSVEGGEPIALPWLPAGPDQTMPLNNQEILYYTVDGMNYRIAQIHGKNPDYIRKGQFGLDQGEFVVQSDSGQGYLKGSADGSMQTVSGGALSSQLLNDDMAQMNGPQASLQNNSGLSHVLAEDNSATLQLVDAQGNVLWSFVVDADKNMTFSSPQGTLTMLFRQILLDASKIAIGPGASDPTTAQNFGLAVTSGPGGKLPFDLVSGAPIPGSSSIRVAS